MKVYDNGAMSTIISHGLSEREAEKRLQHYGPNEIVQLHKLSGLLDFILRFKNPLILILLIAAGISAFFGDWTSSLIIIAIVFLSVVLDFANTYKSERAAEALKNKVKINVNVIRDGVTKAIPLSQIVPGDLVILTAGNIIPADGEVLQAKDFFLNESSLTGESFPLEKVVSNPIYMGSSVITGYGEMTVTATGRSTKFGKIAESLSQKEQPTDFDRGIKDFSYLIMKITFLLIILVFFVNAFLKHNILESFLFAAALAVGLTPELLPMIIAMNLSKGAIAMSKHGVIVKKLSSIQNFGSMDTLCTDKTGTLTEDHIVLIKCVDEMGNEQDDIFHYSYLTSTYHTGFENPLDTAIKDFKKVDISDYKKIDEIPFDFERRRSSVVVENKGERMLITKGAPEAVLAISRFTGVKNEDHEPTLRRARQEYQKLSREGFRVLGISIKKISDIKDVYSRDEEKEMSFVGFIAFLDPAKKSVTETLKNLMEHGIKIKILTGDSELVSQKISDDIQLELEGTLLGSDIDKLTDRALQIKVEKTTLFARLAPEQKVRVITALRKNGHVVGYLGDGINDAPSLRAADVGVSVNNAVDVAKDSADIILLKKSLADLIRGVAEGRKIFSNTLKYLMMALSSNFGNMFSMAGASLLLPFLPMLPVQILLNNLLYDASQFTIPLDNVDAGDILKPRKLNIEFIKRFMIIFGFLSSVFDFITFGLLFVFFHFAASSFQTGWFVESLITQTLVIYIIRTRKNPFIQSRPSKPVVASTLLMVALGIFLALGPLAGLFKFGPITLVALGAIVVTTFVYLLLTEITKRWFYRRFTLSLNEY